MHNTNIHQSDFEILHDTIGNIMLGCDQLCSKLGLVGQRRALLIQRPS